MMRLVVCVLFTVFHCEMLAQEGAHEKVSIDSFINPSSLKHIVEVLASDSLAGRFTGTADSKNAAIFIAEEFKKAGAVPLTDSAGYFMPFLTRGRSATVGVNVIGVIPGKTKPKEIIIFSAHYDHVGTKSTNPYPDIKGRAKYRREDTIFNGANDNASGTSAVIALARYFGALNNNERSILFITFSGEELGLLGSKQAASSWDPDNIKALINIEMIGRPISRRKIKPYITGGHLSDLQALLNQKLAEVNEPLYSKNFFTKDRFSYERLFYRSDNYWFAMNGVPAHTIMGSSPGDDFYHSPADEVSTLDFNFMAGIVKAIAISCSQLTHGNTTPARINKQKIEPRF